jgi:hypothetical protein
MSDGKDKLESDLRSGRFLAGAARGRWRLIQLQWPYALIEVRAGDGRRFTLRFECSGYPDNPPTATLWDIATNQQLPAARWPAGGRVSLAFNPSWKGGTAIYIPCDRQSIAGHSNWFSEHAWLIWNPARGLLQYIEAVYEILNSHELHAQPA